MYNAKGDVIRINRSDENAPESNGTIIQSDSEDEDLKPFTPQSGSSYDKLNQNDFGEATELGDSTPMNVKPSVKPKPSELNNRLS